jgi:hypothetical protein
MAVERRAPVADASEGLRTAPVGPAQLDPRRPAAVAVVAAAALAAGPLLRRRAGFTKELGRALSSGWARGLLGSGVIAGAGLAALAVSASRARRGR